MSSAAAHHRAGAAARGGRVPARLSPPHCPAALRGSALWMLCTVLCSAPPTVVRGAWRCLLCVAAPRSVTRSSRARTAFNSSLSELPLLCRLLTLLTVTRARND